MRNLLIIFSFLLLLPAISFSQETEEEFDHHCLVKENSFTLGLGAVYSLELESVGINSRFYYNVGEHICFGPEFSFVKSNTKQILDLDLVGHYIFETKLVGIYPLVGVNYTSENEDIIKEEAFGVVFGAGLHRNVKNIGFFAEYAHVESKLADDFITLGLFYFIK